MSRCSNVVLVQPGATELCASSRVLGALDVPLSTEGVAQVHRTAERLKELFTSSGSAPIILSADEGPAFQTGEILAELLGLSHQVSHLLANQSLGLWEGLQKSELERKFGRRFCSRGHIQDVDAPPEGELAEDVRERVSTALRRPFRRYPNLIVITGDPLGRYVRDVLKDWEVVPLEPGLAQKSEVSVAQTTCVLDSLTLPKSVPAPKSLRGWGVLGGWAEMAFGPKTSRIPGSQESEFVQSL